VKIGIDTGLGSLIILSKFLGKAVNPLDLKHQLGVTDNFTTQDILLAAKSLDLKARKASSTWSKLQSSPLPAIATDKNGNYFIIAKIEPSSENADTKILIQDPTAQAPEVLDQAGLEVRWSGELIFMTSREKLAGASRKFDVTWFIPAIIKYRKLLMEVLVASFFLQLFALMTPMFFQVVIDKVLVHKGLTTLDVMIFALIVVSIFEVIVSGLRTYVLSHTTNRVDVELGARLFRHMLSLPLSFFEARRVGDTVARVRELDTIREFLTSSSVTLIIDLFFTFVFLGVMYIYSPTLTLIVVISIPFYVLVSVLMTKPLRARLEEKFARGAENQSFLVETITGVQTLKSMAVEPRMQRHWEDKLAGYVQASFKANMLGNIGSQAVQLISKLTTAITLYVGAQLVIAGAITVGQLVAFNMLASRVAAPVLRLAQLWQDFQQARISLERLGDILNSPTESSSNSNRANLPNLKGKIELDNVTFRYKPEGREVLKNVSLNIESGEVIGIVGPSGSGKSTITKLIQRLYVPQSGRLLIDGIDLAMVNTAWLRRQVGVVLQENLLFNRTVRENIALADPTLDMDQVVNAAKMAGAHDFILELQEGYDTKIDERGNNLSGGQRQRIAIARALISNPRILILDEATSALDAESEEIIQTNLRNISNGRTVLIIAHRLSAIKQADRIITVEAGEVTEQGTHEQLMKNKGRYFQLYTKQMSAVIMGNS
jgi:subfamily B ATP-binding cassette protein HlyB/CyaB